MCSAMFPLFMFVGNLFGFITIRTTWQLWKFLFLGRLLEERLLQPGFESK